MLKSFHTFGTLSAEMVSTYRSLPVEREEVSDCARMSCLAEMSTVEEITDCGTRRMEISHR